MDTLKALRDRTLPVGTTRLNLRNCSLSTLPGELIQLSSTLEMLDMSNNPISSLPSDFDYAAFTKLKIVFFSDCAFTTFPTELSLFPVVSMLSFRNNGMTSISDGALPSTLRWLILTGNRLSTLPSDIGRCAPLEKVMLAGNQLSSLPESLSQCRKLALLRLSCNQLSVIPSWLFEMPSLAFLAFSGNPCFPERAAKSGEGIVDMSDEEMVYGEQLGEGASGVIWKARHIPEGKDVAIKKFKSTEVTSDGSPQDEMRAALLAGRHPNLVSVIGRLVTAGSADSTTAGLVLELIPPSFTTLGLSPSFETCSRDVYSYPDGLAPATVKQILNGICDALIHIHAKGIFHGDCYAHNTLFSTSSEIDERKDGHALLGDFGAATIYGVDHPQAPLIERLEVLALGHMVEDLTKLVKPDETTGGEELHAKLHDIWEGCTRSVVGERWSLQEVKAKLKAL